MIALCVGVTAGRTQGLQLSELLYQPRSGEAEYVELYNGAERAVELSEYHIVRVVRDTLGAHYPLPPHSVAPGQYVVLTKSAASVAACFARCNAGAIVECNLPPYPNDGGSVVLSRADSTIVERLDYRPDMHSRLLRERAGVSLERRRFDRPAGESGNWFSAASTAGYGTPGLANSQSAEALVEETAFEFSSTLLSPDGDGYQDELTVSYAVDDGGLAALADVYDAGGRKVRTLLNGDLLGTHGSFVWDGRDDAGRRLATGHYVVTVTIYDRGGTRQTLKRAVAVL